MLAGADIQLTPSTGCAAEEDRLPVHGERNSVAKEIHSNCKQLLTQIIMLPSLFFPSEACLSGLTEGDLIHDLRSDSTPQALLPGSERRDERGRHSLSKRAPSASSAPGAVRRGCRAAARRIRPWARDGERVRLCLDLMSVRLPFASWRIY